METHNSHSPVNVSVGDESEGLREPNLEAYTVVLSTTAHVLSTVFGGATSVAVIAAITTRSNINKYSYTLVLTLLLTCCTLNFVWSPLEVIDLLMYHHAHKHPFASFVAIKTYIYFILILLISFIIVLLSVEGIVRMKNCFGRLFKTMWPITFSVFALVCSAIITGIFIAKSVEFINTINFSYVIIHSETRSYILGLTVFSFSIVAVGLLFLVVFIAKESFYCENGRLHIKQKKMKLAIPEFLISQSNACADNDGGFEHSQSGTPSPSTPKLLSVGNPEIASMKGDEASPVSDLPSPIVKPTGNRLGINMAQVLGRRRHTICQISDSTTAASTSTDTSKAKQYNYVRKFSVDISALQAQLQNPKIFKDAPFQSDINLAKRQAPENSQTPKPLLPLTGKLIEKDKLEKDEKKTEMSFGGSNIPPPPVIMVSNDDAPNNSEEEVPNDVHIVNETFHEQIKQISNAGNAVQKPTSLTLKESTDISVPTFDSAMSDPSDGASDVRKMARLTLLLSLAFVLNMMPVLVTEILESQLSLQAFINISTCTIAVSSIQTIIYPHVISCCDDVVHRAVERLKKRVIDACSCHKDLNTHSQVEDSSSTSQV